MEFEPSKGTSIYKTSSLDSTQSTPMLKASEPEVVDINTFVRNASVKVIDGSSDKIISSDYFSKKGFITSESWTQITNLDSRIYKFDSDFVYCDCLIDKAQEVFESRKFSRSLFGCFEDIKVGKYIYIQIKHKAGSSRIDVFEGENLVERKYFEQKDHLLQDKDYSSLEEKI